MCVYICTFRLNSGKKSTETRTIIVLDFPYGQKISASFRCSSSIEHFCEFTAKIGKHVDIELFHR